jgi:hypothetical protein
MKGQVHMNASEFGCGAGHQLAITAAKAGWELEDFSTLQKSEKKCRKVLQFLRGEADIVLKAKPAPEPEVVIDPIIGVDRSVRPSYPDWVATVMHPELEDAGPSVYDVTKTEQWLHDDQKTDVTTGSEIYAQLKNTGDLKNHATLRDLEEIQKKGIIFFRKYFAGKAVFAWGSVVRNRRGNLDVPYLCEGGDEVVLNWGWLSLVWRGVDPGLRHASSSQTSATVR